MERGGKEKSEKKKKEGKGVVGICGSFSFCSLCLSLLPSPFNPPCHHTSSHPLTRRTTLHTTPHHRTQRTRHTTTPVCCCVSCLCVAVFVSHCLPADSTLNQTTQCHGNGQSPHMGQQMDEAMSDWEGAVVCGHHSTNTRHQKEVRMGHTWLAHICWMDWGRTLTTTAQRVRVT